MQLSLPIAGDGFLLRYVTREDSKALADIEYDQEVKQFLTVPQKLKDRWIKEFDPDTYSGWAIEVDGLLTGRASVFKRGSAIGEIAIVIGRSYWGKELGRRVAATLFSIGFDCLSFKSIQAVVHPDNKASLALLRSYKFRRRPMNKAQSDYCNEGHLVYWLTRREYSLWLQHYK